VLVGDVPGDRQSWQASACLSPSFRISAGERKSSVARSPTGAKLYFHRALPRDPLDTDRSIRRHMGTAQLRKLTRPVDAEPRDRVSVYQPIAR